MFNKLDRLFKTSKQISIDKYSKIVIMSDCHRGIGDDNDNFKKNKNIFGEALNYYYNNGFTYIELGDGDEMWEVKNYENIIYENIKIFKVLKKFHVQNRLHMLYGNHDIIKRNKSILENYFYKYNNQNKDEELLNNLDVYESIILKYNNIDIFLIHGHQVDLINSTFLYPTKFIIRTIWKKIEKIGINNLSNHIKNNIVTNKKEKKLEKWSKKNKKILIAGHTHRAIYPKKEKSLYFNDGCCIYIDGITCIEIKKGNISLIKWSYVVKDNNFISIVRKTISKQQSIFDIIN